MPAKQKMPVCTSSKEARRQVRKHRLVKEEPSPMNNAAQLRSDIIIVDDNPAEIKLLEQMLRQYWCRVRSFPGGRLALAAADKEPPDLILLDVKMPELNGYEVCEKLKSSAHLSGIPVIFLSGLNALKDKVKGFRSGGV